MVISNNPSITGIQADIELLPSGIAQTVSHSIAPAFDTTKRYAKGDIVSYNGKIYKFTTAHAAGAWNASHVIEINAVDELISEATTLAGAAETAAKNASISKTATYQTAESIYNAAVAQAGTNAGNTYIAKTSSYQTADAIVTEAVTQAGTAASNSYIAKTTTYDTVDSILAEAQNKADAAATTAKNASIAKTTTYQSADAIVSAAVAQAGTNASSAYIAKTTTYQTADAIYSAAVAQAGTDASSAYIAKTTTYQTADAIVSTAESYTDTKLSGYSTTTQTNTLISNYVTNNAYGKQSGVAITAGEVKISSNNSYISLTPTGLTFSGNYAALSATNNGPITVNGFVFSKLLNYQNKVYFDLDLFHNTGTTALHYFTLRSFTDITYINAMGHFVLCPNGQTSYSLYIKYDSNEQITRLYGDNLHLGNTDTPNHHILSIRVDYVYWYNHCGQASSRDIKHNIRDMENVSQKISALNPVRFVYDADVHEEEQVGLIYEDVINIIPEICFEQNGEKAIDYIKLVPFLLKEVQRLQNEIEELRR